MFEKCVFAKIRFFLILNLQLGVANSELGTDSLEVLDDS